jgi:orotidine-5'-phosphate decarboxylase
LDEPRIIVALDFDAPRPAMALAERLDPRRCHLKVGSELFTAAGPRLVADLIERGYRVFLDLKFHDIPTTVAAACRQAAAMGIWMVNLHASGGRSMMLAARDAIGAERHPPLLIAVTVLTSLGDDDLEEIGLAPDAAHQVIRLAWLAQTCGLDGVVCSAREIATVAERCGRDFVLVTPGIRPAGSAVDDQKRVMSPAAAVALGAHYLVIGRPIHAAADPLLALARIEAELQDAPVNRDV